MKEQNSRNKLFRLNGIGFFYILVIVAILAWMTYGSLQGVLGMLSYIFIGLLNAYPWIIPFIGIPLGILNLLGIIGPDMFELTGSLAYVDPSWMVILWYVVIIVLSIIVNVLLTVLTILKIVKLRRKKTSPTKNYALINCTIIDGNKDSEPISEGVILIQNTTESDDGVSGRIIGIGRESTITIPSDYKKIDLKGMFVLPGLINAHCHLTGSGKPTFLVKLSDKWLYRIIRILDTPLGRILLKRMMKKNALNALHAGVTTMKTMSDPIYMDLEVRDEINEGNIIGPRLLCSGKGICVTGGHGGAMAYLADSVPEIRKAVRKNLREKVDFIKILSTGGVMDAERVGEAGRPQMTIEEIETACIEAHRGNLLIASHCESTEGIEEALKGGVDSIEHGAEIKDSQIQLFKNNSRSLRGYTYLVPTISAGMGLASLPKEETKITAVKQQNAVLIEEGMIKGLQKAYKEGIRIGVGTDASVPYSLHYHLWKELMYFIRYTGMSNQEAIYYATKNNAELLGIEEETGSIEEGKFADLIVVNTNPLESIDALATIEHVFIKGYFIQNPKIKAVKGLKDFEPILL
ncbi:MAG: Amidohydrolase (modular protein) [Promethearchaeota archaeon]|nr:MAG: Amidohydrolase (modular protein) [Candidatus Lokiarchaeota archaeon]